MPALELSFYTMWNQLMRDSNCAATVHHPHEVRVPFVDVDLLPAIINMSVGEAAPTKLDPATMRNSRAMRQLETLGVAIPFARRVDDGATKPGHPTCPRK